MKEKKNIKDIVVKGLTIVYAISLIIIGIYGTVLLVNNL